MRQGIRRTRESLAWTGSAEHRPNPGDKHRPFPEWLTMVLGAILCGALVSPLEAKPKVHKRLNEAAAVLEETLSGMDRAVPAYLLDRAHCVGIFPSVWKAAFLFGGRYGKGVITCRDQKNQWSAPANFRIEAGNIGFQIGGSSTDLVLLFMKENSMERLLRTGFTLGLDAAAAAGPLGRVAAGRTDALLGTEILTYARSRGLFAGVSFDGATLRPAHRDNRKLYQGWGPYPMDILSGHVAPPAAAEPLLDVLRKYSSEKKPPAD